MISSIISKLPKYFSEGTIVMLSILISFYLEDIRGYPNGIGEEGKSRYYHGE